MGNKQNQGFIKAGGDVNGSSIKLTKSNQNTINKSKTVIKESKPDKYKEEVQVPWANQFNPSAVLYKRTPYINDRPILEIYYNALEIVFNYLGYEVENPNLGLKKLREFTNYIGISKVQVDYYIENVKRNVGGIPNLQIVIPDSYKTRPGEIHTLGVTQFAKRLYYAC